MKDLKFGNAALCNSIFILKQLPIQKLFSMKINHAITVFVARKIKQKQISNVVLLLPKSKRNFKKHFWHMYLLISNINQI